MEKGSDSNRFWRFFCQKLELQSFRITPKEARVIRRGESEALVVCARQAHQLRITALLVSHRYEIMKKGSNSSRFWPFCQNLEL